MYIYMCVYVCRAVCAAAYTKIDGKMEFLWEPTLRMNTVHVFDVARAVYFAAKKLEVGTIWNLSDKGDTDQGRVSTYLGAIFGIETGFYGSTMSTLAKVHICAYITMC
jgi:nucleoside-diphosphate-sugar epimerase